MNSTTSTSSDDAFRSLTKTLVRRYRGRAMLVLVGVIVDTLFDTLLPLSLKFIIDSAIIPRDRGVLQLFLVGLPAAGLLSIVTGITADRTYTRLSAGVMRDIRAATFDRLQSLSSDFYLRVSRGDLASRISSDITELEHVVTYTMRYGFASALGVAATSAALFLLDWRLALFALAGLPVALIIPKLISGRAGEAADAVRAQQGVVQGFIAETVEGQSLVRAYGLQPRIREILDAKLRRLLGLTLPWPG